MRAQSAALGIVAAAAVSSAAAALPCPVAAPGETTALGLTCAVTNQDITPVARDQQDKAVADAPKNNPQPASAQSSLFLDAADAMDDETFAGRGVKITNLQATMTSNKYVAGRLPLAPETTTVEDLIMLAPDYLSAKILPRIPKRNPVGVGLVTVPKPPQKEQDKSPEGQGLWPPRR